MGSIPILPADQFSKFIEGEKISLEQERYEYRCLLFMWSNKEYGEKPKSAYS